MPRLDYKTCRNCGKHSRDVGPISWERLCRKCALERIEANNDQIAAKSGPYFERQQRRQLMAAQRNLLAAEREKG